MSDGTPVTLRFVDRRREGRFDVRDSDDEAVAFIVRPWSAQRFTAFAADGSALCRARRRHPVSRYLDLLAGDGRRLGYLRGGRLGEIVLHDGRRFQLTGRWFGQGWVLVDEAGAEVLWSVRTAASGRTREQLETGRQPKNGPSFRGRQLHVESFLTLGPDDWTVTSDGSLDLAESVAIVEAYRIAVKAARHRS